jgi:HK97 family phage portal protein
MGRIADMWSRFVMPWRRDMREPDPVAVRPTTYATTAGMEVTEDSALTLPAVAGAVRNVAEDVASLPIFFYKRTKQGRDTAFWHPLFSLLHDKPNPTMTPMDMWGAVLYGAMLWGAGFAYVEKATAPGKRWDGKQVKAGEPLAIWPVQRPYRMVTWLEGSKLNYIYVDDAGQGTTFDASEIMPVRGFSKDGVYGMGHLKPGAEAIGAGLAGQVLASTFFGNGSTVGGKLIIPAGLTLTDTAKANLQQSLVDRRSPGNKWKAITLEDGVTFEDDVIDLEKSQLLQSRTFTVREVCRLTRETPDALADLSDANYNNIEMQAINRATRTLRPWWVRIDQAINCFIVSDSQRPLFYAEHEPMALQGDIKTRYEAYGVAVDKGWMNRNEVRQRENMNAMPEGQGEAYTVQSAQTTLEKLVAAPEPIPPQLAAFAPPDTTPPGSEPVE